MWQAEHVRARLRAFHPDLEIELLGVTTTGDRFARAPLAGLGGKGVFVKELEEALLAGEADIAVHSMKDLPAVLAPGLAVPVVLEGGDPRDALIAPGYADLEALPRGARLGTASLRRQCQLKALRPDLEIVAVRGNLDTRLRRLGDGALHGLVLAAAGIQRLGLDARVSVYFSPERMLPAIGQGVVGIECRAAAFEVARLIAPLGDAATYLRVRAERALNVRLGGNCALPLAAHARVDGDTLKLAALIARPDGTDLIRAEGEGAAADAETIGARLADTLIRRGADAILRECTGG
jgi:hydroxymethylbilane synthase